MKVRLAHTGGRNSIWNNTRNVEHGLDNSRQGRQFFGMARTPSTMLPLGTPAPAFCLPDTSRRLVSVTDFADKPALLVMFICNHCPYVKHVRAELAKLAQNYGSRGVGIVAINSNDVVNYPEDSPTNMAAEAKSAGFDFPYLFDESQAVAKAYRAACTPDFFLFDQDRKLVYRGQLDDSRPGNGIPVSGRDLRAALESLLVGKSPAVEQKPSLGCNIKWKAGNEPAERPELDYHKISNVLVFPPSTLENGHV